MPSPTPVACQSSWPSPPARLTTPTARQCLADGGVVLGDKAYDADWIRERIESQGAAPNIPDKANRKQRHCFSKALYKERNHVERFFNRIKYFRRVAMRFKKLAANYLAMIKLASIRVWLRIQKPGMVCSDQRSAFWARAARIGSDAEQPGLATSSLLRLRAIRFDQAT